MVPPGQSLVCATRVSPHGLTWALGTATPNAAVPPTPSSGQADGSRSHPVLQEMGPKTWPPQFS